MSGDNGFGQITEKDVKAMIERDYNSESLRFIYDHRNDFIPVLTNIVTKLNKDENVKDIIINNSNLQNLIVKLTEYTIKKGKKGKKNEKIIVDHGNNISAYVKRCIELMNVKPTKDNIHYLFLLCRKDIENNKPLQEMVTQLKNDKNDKNDNNWKKMVGMLIPKGASVKLHIDGGDLMEQTTNNWVRSSNKHVSIGDNVEGKVEERYYRYGPKFKKIVKIPEGLVGHVYTSNKGTNFIEVDPEAIQLIESEPTKGTVEKGKAPATTEASGATVSPVLPGAKTGATVTPAATGSSAATAAAVAATATTATTARAATEASGLPGAKTGATEEAGAVVAAVVAATATAETEGAAATATAETEGATGAAATGATEEAGAVVAAVVAATGEAVVASGEKGTETTATGAAEIGATKEKKGGSQRLTRKNKKSIGAVRKTRTNH